jgi:hypothetical protein
MMRGSSREEDANLLPSLRAISAADRAASATHSLEGGEGGEGFLPFSNTRLRAYNARLETIHGHQHGAGGGAGGVGTSTSSSAMMASTLPPGSAALGSNLDGGDGDVAAAALAEIRDLRGEIARMEGTLSSLKEVGSERSTMVGLCTLESS